VNLAAIIEGHPAERVAFVAGGDTVTYGELVERVAARRGTLAARGIERGQRVGIIATNTFDFVVAYFAVLGLGAIAVPLNPESPSVEIDRELAAVGATEVLTAAESTPGAPTPTVPVTDLEPGDVAVLVFTSGTAGAPRAAMLTHGSLLANIDQVLAAPDRIGPDDIVIGVLPVFHVFGLSVALHLPLAAGARVVLEPRFDPVSTLEDVGRHGVTIVPGAPPMWIAWAGLPEIQPAAFAPVRLALSGAAKLPEEIADVLERRFGLVVLEGYGLTEASPIVTTSVGIEPRRGSVGQAIDGVEVRLVDSDGADVLDGDPGEIWVRGPNVFAGYWGDPDATARVLTPDGWLRTGDIAVVDDDYLYIVDRAKDLVIVSGFNVYPAEVEQVIADHPHVAEVAVVGVPHPTTGEAVRAYVVAAPGTTVDEATVQAWCRERLARYKCPSSVLVVDQLPKGLTGKVLRRVLR
jgi:long-chain acyl-CoA synthetase